MNKKTQIQLENEEFNYIIKDIIENYTVQQMKKYMQHFDTTCFEHCYMASYYCYHMFPITVIPPKSKEGWLLTIIDKYCTTMDFVEHVKVNYKFWPLIKRAT